MLMVGRISNKARVAYFDILRGIAIVMVIGIHTSDYSVNIAPIQLLCRSLLSCAVPLFVALSGYFAHRKLLSVGYAQFLSHQIPKIYLPVLFWSLPLAVIGILHGFPVVSVLVKSALCGMSIYYFVAIIIQMYVLSFLFVSIKQGGVAICCVLSTICNIIFWYLSNLQGLEISLSWWSIFPLWIDFFVIGMYLSTTNRDYKIGPYVVAFVAALLLSFAEERYWISCGFRCSGTILSHICCLLAVCIFMSKRVQSIVKEHNIVSRLCAYVGRRSFGVYLTHMYIISWVMGGNEICFGWALKTAFVLGVDIVCIYMARRILPSNILSYIGF